MITICGHERIINDMTIASSAPIINIDCLAKDKWTKNKSQNKNHHDSIFIAHYHIANELYASQGNILFNYVQSTYNKNSNMYFLAKNVWSYERYYFRKGKKTKRIIVGYSAAGNSVPFSYVEAGGRFELLSKIYPKRFTYIINGVMMDTYNNPLFPGLNFIEVEKNQWIKSDFIRLMMESALPRV